ncbi:MAG TPA: YjfB family protein [Rhodocyclaceae bacterium]|nr:YjfB family protein [Rhodocyclaceae bacterium]
MDVSSIAALSSDMAAAKAQDSVQLAVLKKAMDQQGAAVLPLIAAATGAAVNPAHLGQSVDVFA